MNFDLSHKIGYVSLNYIQEAMIIRGVKGVGYVYNFLVNYSLLFLPEN